MIFALAPHPVLAEPPPDGRAALDQAFQKLVTLELGQDLGIFDSIRQAVVASRTDERVRADLESRLVAVLRGDASDLGKDYACRQLAIVGSDASLPSLAELLPNPRMSYMARYALEGIGSPAAKRTLREMLGKTEGRQKVGVVISLGRLADREAVPAVAALLAGEDNELREACLVALGRIGSLSAAEAIQGFAKDGPKNNLPVWEGDSPMSAARKSGQSPDCLSAGPKKAPESLRPVVVDALLDTVASVCREGERKEAVAICESLLSADSERVRAAGFRGLIAAEPSNSLALVIGGLKSDEPWKRAVAADWVVGLDKPKEIGTIASTIGELPAAGKIAALVGLEQRCHPAIREAALEALGQQDPGVRAAALAALIRSGTPEDVPALAALLTGEEDESVRNAAFETLRLMPVEGVNGALIAWMAQGESLPAVVVECALARRSPDFVPLFLKAAGSSDGATRLAAFKALEIMATGNEAQALAALACRTAPGEEREAADRAVWMSCQKIADPARRSAPLLTAMEKGDAEAQCVLLPILARIGGRESLPAVHTAMESGDQAVRDAGYRALANWPDASVAEELLEIAKTSDVESYREWSLRAYARVVALPGERAPQKTFELLRDAMKMATRKEDKELFVSRLGAVRAPDALALLLTFLDDGELKEAAVPAVFTLAKGLSQSHPAQAAAALRKIEPMTEDAALQQQIPKVLRDIDARKQNNRKSRRLRK